MARLFLFQRWNETRRMTQDAVVLKSAVFIRRGGQILVFRHPSAGVQLPKGTVEPGETLEDAARREVFEEVRLTLSGPLTRIGVWDCPSPKSTWHVFVADAPVGTAEAWRHAPSGGGEEAGLLLDVFWIEMSAARDLMHPLFLPVIDIMEQYIRSE